MVVIMKNVVFWGKKTQFIPHRKHITSSLQSQPLNAIKFRGLHSRDYEECRLLGYNNPVRTSQNTHYFSATESSWLMVRKI
jgi:hypothetical protein